MGVVTLWYIVLSFCNLKDTLVYVTLDDFGDPIKALGFTCSQNLLNYLVFQPFDFERIWWGLFQKRVVRTKLDIYVLLINSSNLVVTCIWRITSTLWYYVTNWLTFPIVFCEIVVLSARIYLPRPQVQQYDSQYCTTT